MELKEVFKVIDELKYKDLDWTVNVKELKQKLGMEWALSVNIVEREQLNWGITIRIGKESSVLFVVGVCLSENKSWRSWNDRRTLDVCGSTGLLR